MTTVELETAFVWNCPDCRSQNTELPVTGELDDDEFDEFCDIVCPQEYLEIPTEGDGFEAKALVNRVVFQPRFVKCPKCGATCETELPFDEEGDDEGGEHAN